MSGNWWRWRGGGPGGPPHCPKSRPSPLGLTSMPTGSHQKADMSHKGFSTGNPPGSGGTRRARQRPHRRRGRCGRRLRGCARCRLAPGGGDAADGELELPFEEHPHLFVRMGVVGDGGTRLEADDREHHAAPRGGPDLDAREDLVPRPRPGGEEVAVRVGEEVGWFTRCGDRSLHPSVAGGNPLAGVVEEFLAGAVVDLLDHVVEAPWPPSIMPWRKVGKPGLKSLFIMQSTRA